LLIGNWQLKQPECSEELAPEGRAGGSRYSWEGQADKGASFRDACAGFGSGHNPDNDVNIHVHLCGISPSGLKVLEVVLKIVV